MRSLFASSLSLDGENDRCGEKEYNLIWQLFASVAQLVEQRTENPRVVGSIPTGGTTCGFSSFGRARPCQGRGGGFEPRNPLHTKKKRCKFLLFYSEA